MWSKRPCQAIASSPICGLVKTPESGRMNYDATYSARVFCDYALTARRRPTKNTPPATTIMPAASIASVLGSAIETWQRGSLMKHGRGLGGGSGLGSGRAKAGATEVSAMSANIEIFFKVFSPGFSTEQRIYGSSFNAKFSLQ